MDDIYSWILSPEIREYLRGNYKPDLMERQALIRSAYRPVEEKLSALQELLREAETEEAIHPFTARSPAAIRWKNGGVERYGSPCSAST